MAKSIILPYKDDLIIPDSDNAKALFTSWQCGIKHICLSGGRGMGKSVDLILYALHLMSVIPRLRVIWCRTEYSTIRTTIIKTLQNVIMKYPLGDSRHRHPKNPFTLHGGVKRPSSLELDNGSEMEFIGLDIKSKTRGLEADIGILNEGTREETDEAWSEMSAVQAGGRGGAFFVDGMPFNQVITDTNPDAPTNWIYRLFRSENPDDDDVGIYNFGERLFIGYTHTDNPLHRNADGTPNDLCEQKVSDLEKAYHKDTFDYQRMVLSQWCAAVGLVYSMWNPDAYIVPMHASDFALDSSWYIGIDLGGESPFAFCLVNKDANGIKRIFKEGVRSRCLFSEVEGDMLNALSVAGITKSDVTLVSDTNIPSFIRELRQNGWHVIEAEKGPKGSIESRY